ncbi:MAG: hypothetical protein NTY96_01080 [Bacteroidetes bacterium]|nr:hypothetical protein [Bacteroidota bacterium]
MKKGIISVFFVFTIFIVNAQSKVDTLTNAKIIQLSKIGLQSSVIINKIQSSYTLFDVSTDAIINLSQKGVSSEVINEMMKSNNSKQSEIASKEDNKNPNAMHKNGIYYYNPANSEKPLSKLDPVKVSYETHSGGYGGYGGSSTTANLNGVESKLKIYDNNPTFYFYFDDKGNGSDWFESTSPNEFELAKLIVKKDKRYCKVGGASSGFMSSSENSGIPEKDKIPFEYEKIQDGIYKIKFGKPLKPGEYCFVYSSNSYKVFDFGIQIIKEIK